MVEETIQEIRKTEAQAEEIARKAKEECGQILEEARSQGSLAEERKDVESRGRGQSCDGTGAAGRRAHSGGG